jgi:hypothetical protein
MGGEWRRESILVDHVGCHFGGSRPLFRCPWCEHRRCLLYLPASKANFGCRVCWKLAHAVEAEDAPGRMWRKQCKLAARLGAENRADPHPPRPRGMHRRTINECSGKYGHARRGETSSSTCSYKARREQREPYDNVLTPYQRRAPPRTNPRSDPKERAG